MGLVKYAFTYHSDLIGCTAFEKLLYEVHVVLLPFNSVNISRVVKDTLQKMTDRKILTCHDNYDLIIDMKNNILGEFALQHF